MINNTKTTRGGICGYQTPRLEIIEFSTEQSFLAASFAAFGELPEGYKVDDTLTDW